MSPVSPALQADSFPAESWGKPIAEYLGSLKISSIFPISRNSDLSNLRWVPGIDILKKNARGDLNEQLGTRTSDFIQLFHFPPEKIEALLLHLSLWVNNPHIPVNCERFSKGLCECDITFFI